MKIAIALAAIVAVFLLVVAFQPSTFRVERSATIAAPSSVVFAHVNDLHQWQAWSAWEKIDPNLKRSYEGPATGKGAVYSWVGNKDIGEGRMTIVESRPSERIGIKLEFFKPFAATNAAEFTFKPEGNRTVVTWSMAGQNNFICKAVGMFMNMDKMVGGKFEEGLTNLKALSETQTVAAK